MANSKDIRLKKFKIVFGWILGLAIIALSFWAYNITGYGCKSPNSAAMSDLRNLKTNLEAYHADHDRYPQPDEVPSFSEVSDDVTASWMTLDDKNLYFAIAFHKEGDKIIFTTSETHYIYYIYWRNFSEQGLVPLKPL